MNYKYFGLRKQIKKYLDLYPQHVINDLSTSKLQISLNIDGLPLFSSSNLSAWPILCRLCLDPPVVLPISIAIGPSKPKNLDFLNDIVSELKEVLKEGLTFRNQSIEIVLHSIIADAPAKAMVKAVKQYSGYFGCDRCTQKGSWFEGRVIYPQIKNIVLRSDVHFRSQQQQQHRHGISPLSMLPIDMISTFPIDYMHQACLEVMKKLLYLWIRVPKFADYLYQELLKLVKTWSG